MSKNSEKKELEVYARERFGVELDRRKGLNRLKEEVAELERKTVNANIEGAEVSDDIPEEAQQEASEETQAVQEVGQASKADEMNDLALRIWDGQSVSLPRTTRVNRIISRLKDKGFDCIDKLELPE